MHAQSPMDSRYATIISSCSFALLLHVLSACAQPTATDGNSVSVDVVVRPREITRTDSVVVVFSNQSSSTYYVRMCYTVEEYVGRGWEARTALSRPCTSLPEPVALQSSSTLESRIALGAAGADDFRSGTYRLVYGVSNSSIDGASPLKPVRSNEFKVQ